MRMLDIICFLLVLVGGLNWGLVGIAEFNLVDYLFHTLSIDRLVYSLVGLASLYIIFGYSKIKARCMDS